MDTSDKCLLVLRWYHQLLVYSGEIFLLVIQYVVLDLVLSSFRFEAFALSTAVDEA
jgi:hypothetical protein